VFTLLVGRAYNLTHLQSTTRNKHRHRLWPMVAAQNLSVLRKIQFRAGDIANEPSEYFSSVTL